jgi:hypothetical protein
MNSPDALLRLVQAGAGQRGLQLRALLHRALAGVVADRLIYRHPCLSRYRTAPRRR